MILWVKKSLLYKCEDLSSNPHTNVKAREHNGDFCNSGAPGRRQEVETGDCTSSRTRSFGAQSGGGALSQKRWTARTGTQDCPPTITCRPPHSNIPAEVRKRGKAAAREDNK